MFSGGSVNMESVNSDGKRTMEVDRGSSVMPVLPSNDDEHVKQNPSAKLLTLPTILTIARVASVPLLISSMFLISCV